MTNCCLNLGIKDAPSIDDSKRVFSFLQRNFKTIYLKDFAKAFDLFSGQQLKFDDPKFGHYGSFDLVFIGKVLKSYSQYKMEQAKKPKELKPIEVERQIGVPKKTKEENAKEWYGFINEEFEKKGKVPLLADWNAAFWHMKENNIFKLDKDELEMFADNVRADIEHDIKVRKAEHRDFRTEVKILSHDKSFKIECRKRYLINYFNNLKTK